MGSELIASSCSRVVVGLGKTGLSCVRYLSSKQLPFKVMDTRDQPPGIDQLRKEFPDVEVHTGGFNQNWLNSADELVVSPGIAVAEPAIAEAIVAGAHVVGDIELFCREAKAPIVAITGSNGKSTVTTLLGEMAEEAGLSVGVGGNIGIPALELLEDGGKELYILELSSFQLETTHSLEAAAATVLNLSPDHMDRYPSMVEYHQAKQRIYKGCKSAVYNKQDALTTPLLPVAVSGVAFTAGKPDLNDYGLLQEGDTTWLCKGVERLLDCSQMKLCGQHNQTNALSALALGEQVGIPLSAMLEVLKRFTGLKHRCEWVAERDGVVWINDSKATNVGATVAAIEGLGSTIKGKLVLIAGGDGKDADFSDLEQPVSQYVRTLVLMGRDAPAIEQAVEHSVSSEYARDLGEAIAASARASQPGDIVLLAPACASFDMFASFEQRGDLFRQQVVEFLGIDRQELP
ncbi:UDP-N-acetylmuramoyl-L-alanyl-D-glutamate synthetase [Endozoicomonas montiporae]|uniref:UDP-N-acetylmuramoylalanine--D-glutamate ligase n=2 Tax=Endozoicomonas montiporae TaxID=1027273 RepID=A0A081N634_9GAMM|nr:UDP-N-acetylmuramoyl-L-alanine--D-glutamate ligase [Endozoicomonas montiporae]AMO57174.1 UDP-N-acetylmuramoyl-L-alanyl-D-glutamate synthetase [Endozoicomonas montiporae CL-33]KEQ13907.1 UDP-N-acetylmuramoyl-L-alanyl-D-glutamate synthetase [Endozoicomonas montiporae]